MAPPFFMRYCPELHLVALLAVTLGAEGVLAVVTGAAGFPLLHPPHADMLHTSLEGEDLGVAVGAFVHAEMELVAEFDVPPVGLEGYHARLEPLVAAVAVAGDGGCILAVVAGAAGFALLHVGHGEAAAYPFVGEDFGMAGGALVIHVEMKLVAEDRVVDPLGLEHHLFRLHSFVAGAAVLFHGECALAVMTGAARLSLLHFRHGDRFAVGDYDLAVVAALALAAGLGDMSVVAENHVRGAFGLVGDVARFPRVAANAVLFAGDAECLDAGMTGAARFGLLHFGHGEVAGFPDIEDGVMTNLAIIAIFSQVQCVAEDDRISILEFELDIFCFSGV